MPKKESINRSAYKNEYQRKTATKFNFIFRNDKDTEVIEKIKSVPNKSDYIRQLVLRDIAEEKNK